MPVAVVLVASADPSTEVPTTWWMTWEAPDGTSTVRYGSETLDRQTPPGDPSAGIPLVALAGGSTWQWQAVTVAADGTEHASEVQSFTVAEPPELAPSLVVDRVDPERSEVAGLAVFAGYSDVLGAAASTGGALAVHPGDGGPPIWWWSVPAGAITLSPWTADDAGLWFDVYSEDPVTGVDAALHHMSLDGTTHQAFPVGVAHHVILPLPPDEVAWIYPHLRPIDVGWSQTDGVRTAPLSDLGNPRDLFDTHDHMAMPYEAPCGHVFTPYRRGALFPVFEWTHGNSLVHLPESDRFLVYTRWTDTLYAVDRTTGAVDWQLGGARSDFTWADGEPLYAGAEDPGPWSHAHLTDAWEGGALVFDNGDHYDPPASSVVELAWDEEARTVREVWRYSDPDGGYQVVLGDARRLPGGNVLVAWTAEGRLTEVTREGDVVWEAHSEPALRVSRVRVLSLDGVAR
ncbi:MAG: hypothetical protein ACI8PZ_003601 [Myxococcota bacterium]